MQTPPSSSSASVAGDSPRMQRKSSDPDTPRRLALPKMSNFLTLASPKRLQREKHQHQLQQQDSTSGRDKNEPSRFLGDGVSFKAKLIGILEVGEARGDRMCQEALADLKMAIRAAGEHKQRITINIAIDGLRLRDEKTMDCLYHHPVHKISFIAQDMTDSRAFGYIFGSPDTGHRFFGIKTDKAAGQVVVAMRDLFQVVFELKKKEIELAKQHIEQQQQMKFSVGKSLENLTYSKSLLDSGGRYSALKDESKLENGCSGAASKSAQQTSESENAPPTSSSGQFDVFTELDPLGTGRSRPYVDKKDFFQELKNPPKKVLKDLADPRESETGSFVTNFSSSPLTLQSERERCKTPTHRKYSADIMALDPFADADPFGEPEFNEELFPPAESSTDPFDTCFADFTMFGSQKMDKSGNAADVFHGPLRVSLPPEKRGSSLLPPPPATSKRSSPTFKSSPKSPRSPLKQKPSVSDSPLVRIPSPQTSRRRSGAVRRSPLAADEERMSNSSVELTDTAPEPPPRPATSKPPPLPPKKQLSSQQYKPPRPPPSEHYDYINNIEPSGGSVVSSPPLPMPVRRPRTSSTAEIPRPRQSQQQDSAQFALPPPPTKEAAKEIAAVKEEKKPKVAANLTLRQLTKMNITELASSLSVSPGHLSKMTLQELASFLGSVSAEGSPSSSKDVSVEPIKVDDADPVDSESYSALRESLDGEEVFKVDFENNFADFSTTDLQNLKEDVFQEAPFDKYAVFRELEQDDPAAGDNQEDNTETAEFEDAVQDSIKEEAELPRSDSAMAEEGLRDEELEDYTEDGDKYAALREICSEDAEPQAEGDESDKDDSESVTKKVDEDMDLLSISRQPSDSPESVTMEATLVRESIIESTILEEEGASDGGSQYEEPVELPVEIQPLQEEEEEAELEQEPEELPEDPIEKSPLDEEPVVERVVSPPKELVLPPERKEEEAHSPGGGWAKFEEEVKQPEEQASSPWSVDSKEFGGKAYTPEKNYSPDSNCGGSGRRHRYRRRGSRESPWQDDEEEDDDEWGERENGWRDEHYRRPRKRSPWGAVPKRASPWEDDDEESYDETRSSGYKPRRPATARSSITSRRPPSWDDEEPEFEEPRRRPPHRYEDKRDRSGSRGGEIARRREWDDVPRSKYASAYAAWAERAPTATAARKASSAERRRKQQLEGTGSSGGGGGGSGGYYAYRDREYDEQMEARYRARKGPPKRPSSAADLRKGRPRGRHSPEDDEDDDGGGRFRTPSADVSRGQWREDFNSDHESAPPREQHYEQRAYTMHSKRRQKRRDDFYHAHRSPFDDDEEGGGGGGGGGEFFTKSFHASEFSSMESPTAEAAVRRSTSPTRPSSTKASHGSSRRSPFEDDFTPPETRRGSARPFSSISSDVSRSPHDPAFRNAPDNDVFLPEQQEEQQQAPPPPPLATRGEKRWSEERQLSGLKSRLSLSARTTSLDPNNIKKSESVNIFARDSDPFDDDFFAETDRQRKKNNGDAFKWSEPFGSFDFKEEDEEEE